MISFRRRALWRSPIHSASHSLRSTKYGSTSRCQGRFVPSGTPRMLNVTSCSVMRQRTDFCNWSSSTGERSARKRSSKLWCARSAPPASRNSSNAVTCCSIAFGDPMYGRESTATTMCHTRDSGRMSRNSRHAAQIESERKVRIELGLSHCETAWHVPHVVEAGNPSTFGGRRVDRPHFVGSTTGVNDVIRATRDRALVPVIVDVDVQRPVDADGRVQAGRGLPGAVTHAANSLPQNAGGLERQWVAVDRDHVAPLGETECADLQSFQGRIDVASLTAGAALFTEHVPRFERPAYLHEDRVFGYAPVERKTELVVRAEPFVVELIAALAQVTHHVAEVLLHEVGQEEAIVEQRAPLDERCAIRALPERRHQRAEQELLCARHPVVRRHLERAQLQQAEAPGGSVRRIHLVDAKLGAVGIARDVRQKVAENAIDQPRGRVAAHFRQLAEGHFQLVNRVISGFIDTRCLRRWADEA